MIILRKVKKNKHWNGVYVCSSCGQESLVRLTYLKHKKTDKCFQCNKPPKNLLTGDKRYQWKGGKTYIHGYVFVHCPEHPLSNKRTKKIAEHRLIMMKHLGRLLMSQEIVHHENSIKSDNRLENLKLFKNSREHQLYHEKRGDGMMTRLHKESK